MNGVAFFVPGVPAPQGSKRLVRTKAGQTIMLDANSANLKEWRRAVTLTAKQHPGSWVKGQPLSVSLDFTMPATLKDRAGWCAVRPDLDKLVRAVFDGLTDAGAIVDDSQVAVLTASKQRGIHCGVQVLIVALSALLEETQ